MKYVVQALWKNEHAMFRARARPNIVLHKNLVLSMTWTRYLSIWCSSVVAAVIHSGLVKAFPELSWDFTSKIKVGLSLRQILSPCHCLESYPPRWLQLSNCCAHHGTLEVRAKTLQTVKVHIKVCSLQGRPAIFSPRTDMEPELYNVPALFFVLNELVDELVGLQLPNVCLSVKGPWWFSHDNLSSPWSISQDKCTLVPRVSFKGCLWLYTHTLGGDCNTNVTHSDQNMLVFILSSSSPCTFPCHFVFFRAQLCSFIWDVTCY